MESTQSTSDERHSWLDRPLASVIHLNWETALFTIILLLAFVSRFYNLGARVMSHDEVSHVYFSWRLYRGEGYQHDPITHGPLQFHLIALSYFLFGDNDFTARIPHALASVAAIAFLWKYRRYFGHAGTLVAAFLSLISPFMLYYGRYARNEALVALFGTVMLWAMLRYLESGETRFLYWLTAATVLHFTSKETAFIYTAQALLFLGLLFIAKVLQTPWQVPKHQKKFLVTLLLFTLLLLGAATLYATGGKGTPLSASQTVAPAIPGQGGVQPPTSFQLNPAMGLIVLALIALVVAAFYLLRGYTLEQMRYERSFDLLILLGTLVLPMLAPFPVRFMGWNPIDYSPQGILRTAIFLIPLALIALGIGLWWNLRLWLTNAALFYSIFTVFYTTIFTNGAGFFTGLVGSLGYWLEQQGVNRGSQPWYYYILVQIPVYEFLPALGSLLGLGMLLGKQRLSSPAHEATQTSTSLEDEPSREDQTQNISLAPILLAFWVLTSILAYSYAGEKMPWLTVHIALPMILFSGWSIGRLIDNTDWRFLREQRGWLVIALMAVFLLSLTSTVASLLGTNPPFQGKELAQLQATSTFLTSLLTVIASGWGLFYLTKTWLPAQISRLITLTILGLLAVLTVRTSIRAAYINYDNATEFLVYAHSARGPKDALEQIEEISRRITDGLDLVVAYDNETSYPYWWYLRNFPNQRYYGENPTRDLRQAPIILVGQDNYSKIEPVVGQGYYRFDYIRLWWPNQDYFNLTWERIWNAVSSPQWRSALFQIWFHRDFSKYGTLTNRDMSLTKWQPSTSMRMYIKKDIVAQLWNYGITPAAEEIVTDPYEGKEVKLSADIVLGSLGSAPGQFQRPRDLAIAPDGSIYVADTGNHRIQHLARDGSVLHVWGTYASILEGEAPPGTFNEPWGIAVAPDGSVYVMDTWNFRIQKFTPDGQFIQMWGYDSPTVVPFALYGPRDGVLDSQGRLLVSDTGNRRIVIYDAEGNYLSEFGKVGFAPGQFDEPVGLAIDHQDNLYVADTWNQRIQVFAPDGTGGYYPLTSWEVYAWFGQSIDNKPYIAVDDAGYLFATDPEGYRVLQFTTQGEIMRYWGDYGLGNDGFGLVGSVAVDPTGGVWVSDTGNSRLMHFTLP